MTTLSSYTSNPSLGNMQNNLTASSLMARNSRISSFNPMRSTKQLPLPPPPITNPNPNLHQNNIPHRNPSVNYPAPEESDNFALTRVDTNHSIDSKFSVQLHYEVTLNLNKKEIELIRYTWNKLLLEEPIVEKKSVLPQMPGQFPIEAELHMKNTAAGAGNPAAANSASKSLNFVKQTSSTAMASTLFCRQLYGNLLQMEPRLEKMFPSVRHQAAAFAGVMSLAISQLENISNIDDYLTKLGKRHARILCIEAPQFELMGEALIQTFHERFGIRFNHDLEILWIKLYMYLSNSMIQFGMDPKLKLNRNDNTGNSKDHLFEQSKLDSDENLPMSDNYSMLAGGDPATRTTSYSAASIHGDYFDDRKGSVSTMQTSVMTKQPLMQNLLVGAESAGSKPGKKKKLRTSIRTKTKENCVIV